MLFMHIENEIKLALSGNKYRKQIKIINNVVKYTSIVFSIKFKKSDVKQKPYIKKSCS